MKIRKVNQDLFDQNYLSVIQLLFKLADTTFAYAELGRGSGKTTHLLAPRMDRIQSDMPGSVLLLAAPTYKSILDNIIPGLMEYFQENYERGIYYEVGKRPPRHFKSCASFIENWNHTISFSTGTVVQLVSADRPESALGKNGAHLFIDEMLRIPEEKFTNRVIPALRADRSKFGHSPFFMGITGTSSSPDMEMDETWFLNYESNMNKELIKYIQEIAYEVDLRYYELFKAEAECNLDQVKRLTMFINRWEERLKELRKNQTYYVRASSFSNMKILGLEYIENQIKSIKNIDDLNTSIFAVRKFRVKDRFFGRFAKEHLFHDGCNYTSIDSLSIDNIDVSDSTMLRYCDPRLPLFIGYDPGPFSSIVVAQRKDKKFRIIKTFTAIHPAQHPELASDIQRFFKNHKNKMIFFHYDRAANQRDPRYRDFYKLSGDINDTDANLLSKYLREYGWRVQLMSMGQPVVYYSQHYRLLSELFGKNDGSRDDILIDANECEDLVSSINHSPVKRTDGKIELDKSSEKKLELKDQRYYSTQISSALMYLLWGEYKKILPMSDHIASSMGGTWSM